MHGRPDPKVLSRIYSHGGPRRRPIEERRIMSAEFLSEVSKRRTFAIISHPDAGKTTITEKVLLFGQAIQRAGTVKGRGSGQHAKSD